MPILDRVGSRYGNLDDLNPEGTPDKALEVLKTLQPNSLANQQANLYGLQDERKTELEHNLELQKRFPDQIYAGGTPGDVQSLEHDMAPMNQQIQAQHAAEQSGYNSPQEAAQAQRLIDYNKTTMPLQVEQEKTRGAMQLENTKFDRLMKLFNGGAADPTGGAAAASDPQIEQEYQDALKKASGGDQLQTPQSQSWWDFFTGKGPNSAGSAMDAANERLKYFFMATPYAKLNQDISFANLQQLASQFPGVRGFSYLLPLMSQHQANFGHGESLSATYNRLKGMHQIMGTTIKELQDPRLRFGVGADGQPKLNMLPATIARGMTGLTDAQARTADAIRELERLHPELLQTQVPGRLAPNPMGRGKTYLDDNGNPR